MEAPEADILFKQMWQLFATLTFSGHVPVLRKRMCMSFAWLRQVSRASKIEFSSLLWVLRNERGEIGAREHFHCLIAGLPAGCTEIAWRFRFKNMWESLGGGMARVRRYDTLQSGVSYVTKCLDISWDHDRANYYEFRKFLDQSCELTLSHSLIRAHRRLKHRVAGHEWRRVA
jgi:hypothetical protein